MKKLLTIFALFFALKSAAQYPVTQNLGSDNTLIRLGPNYGGAIKGNIINKNYADTTAANATVIDSYPGALIYTTGDNTLWVRNSTATKWVQDFGGTNIYNSNGTITGDRIVLLDTSTLQIRGENGSNILQLARLNDTVSYLELSGSTAVLQTEAFFGGLINRMTLHSGVNGGKGVVFNLSDSTFIIDNLHSGLSTDSLLTYNATTGRVGKRPVSDILTNIYNSDGTLPGNRILNGDGYNLIFDGVSRFGAYTADINMTFADSFVVREGGTSRRKFKMTPTGIYLDTLVSGSTTDSVMTWNASSGMVSKRSAGTTAYPIRTTTSNVTFGDGDYTVIVTGGTPTVTLPTASSYIGRIFRLVNNTLSSLTVSSFIDFDGSAATTISGSTAYEFQSNGTNWYSVGR